METEPLIKIAVVIAVDLALSLALILFILAPLLVLAWDFSLTTIIPGCHILGYFEAVGLLGLITIVRLAIRGVHVEPR